MQITDTASTLKLVDMPLDVGYASEKVSLKNREGEIFALGGQNGATQLLIAAPLIEESLITQLQELDTLLRINALEGITKALIVASDTHEIPHREEWLIGYDYDEAFGDYYGVRLSNRELAKSLYLLSKDGAVFYHEILSDHHAPFDLEKALVKIAAAQTCYTGKGCHG
jgi:peroxiredoxin